MARISIDLASGQLKDPNLIVGIDLGTTNSLIARMQQGQPQALADFEKDVMVPSLVHIAASGEVLVGEAARPYLELDPANTVYSVKRLMGKTFAEAQALQAQLPFQLVDEPSADGMVRIRLRGTLYSPVELSAMILRELRQRAEHRLKQDVHRAVITVPAYFDDAQRQATREAGKMAGLEVLRIVNEPTAAALAYGLGHQNLNNSVLAVYDLGGGTFDITILKLEDGIFDVLSTNGDTFLGGDDLDRAIVDSFLQQTGLLADALSSDKTLAQNWRLLAEEAKKHLSTAEVFATQVALPDGRTQRIELNRSDFERLAAPLVERSLNSCRQALRDAELSPQQVDQVVLVGGSTRVPLVQRAVAQFFGREPLCSLNPDEVVALGAAVQADILAGNQQELLLLDVTPLSLGIETAGGLMDVIIPRNSKVPARAARRYTTGVDGQVNLKVAVYQGEREMVADNRLLGIMELRGIPAMPAGLPKIEVAFLLDADGILRVEAREERSGVKQSIAIQPKAGLTDEELERRLLDSLQHAQDDMAQRLWIEAREEARQLVYHTRGFLKRSAALLKPEQHAETLNLMAQLEALFDQQDRQKLQEASERLEAYTRPFAEMAMDMAVQEALQGRRLEDAGS